MRIAALACLILLAACQGDDDTEVDPGAHLGTVRLVTATAGIGTDTNGYTVTFHDSTFAVGAFDTNLVDWEGETNLALSLGGIDGPCRIHDSRFRTVGVNTQDTVTVSWQVDCGIITAYTSHPTIGPAFVDFEVVTGRASGYTTNGKYPLTWDFSPDGMRIVTSVFAGDNKSKLYILGRTAGDSVPVVTSSPRNEYPTWSPNGNDIRFVSGSDSLGFTTLSVPPTGQSPAPVPGMGGYRWALRWSRQGDRIAYVGNSKNVLYTSNPDGTDPDPIATGPYSWIDGPEWAPSGDSIVYFAPILVDSATIVPLFIVPSAGGVPVQLTQPGAQGYDFSPSWSKDGRYIAYIHQANNSVNDRTIVVLDLTDGSSKTITWSAAVHSLRWRP